MSRFCKICQVNIDMRDSRAVFCFKCKDEKGIRTGGTKAINLVKKAIENGILLPLEGLLCVDCGAQAKCYDHRDYNKPLEVEPVCKKCNRIRGPGIYLQS